MDGGVTVVGSCGGHYFKILAGREYHLGTLVLSSTWKSYRHLPSYLPHGTLLTLKYSSLPWPREATLWLGRQAAQRAS
ncbi:uncharacterized protein CLUP02_08351 [Colletotrichum lupini]|uniref:Uncharacterized protein n=1 Tax=Colletotrichum lupini TaxID=145971 RepID=A0A9Q8SST4_9PEZI|nr:uncharacterized protein CLUP02_08351 [Colletotrichum lupini]UQC82861.1 hypothetical protein CLUP02_08351 [Colletotrichum lupini]